MQVSPHCYALTGLAYLPPWSVNAGIVIGSHTSLIVDTSASAHSAATIYGYATAARPQNKLLVINTEKHFDHIGGNSFFRDRSIDILAHPASVRTEAEFQAEKEEFNRSISNAVRRNRREESIFYAGTSPAPPSQLVTEPMSLDLGDLSVHILLTPGHTPTNLSVYVPADQVLFPGDCLISGYLPNLDCGSSSDWRGWLQSLDRIEQLSLKVIVPGHGPVLCNEAAAKNVAAVRSYVEYAISTGITLTTVAE